ncbi:integrase arm-type DNA-binding domain-containing protein [Pseudogulbenkiania sp. MAI-1]|uniref:tyrosine-type recombinase/integrase n=1 Tax=Pseudogulbenkiania sp. MAI-1 TaxID=990370 RepID=UPI00045E8813|nr:integrase arm-type DNA-binding domain-containing protein [Pseudogulbenkiania sp. MAI-1]
MALTDTKLRNLKPADKDTKLSDSGGLYLLVRPNGSKLWRLKFRLGEKEGVYSIGQYPQVTLAEARLERDRAKKLIAEGKNPTTMRKIKRLENQEAAANHFEAIAREFYDKLKTQGRTVAPGQAIRLLELYVFPKYGDLPIGDIKPTMILSVLKELEARGIQNTAARVRHVCGQVFRYGVSTLRCEVDPTASIRGAVMVPITIHHKPADDPQAVWKAINGYKGMGFTRLALMLLMLTLVRSKELRYMEKDELDLDDAIWKIPGDKMKKRRPHVVPLPHQAVELLKAALTLSGDGPYVFPNQRTAGEPMSEATMLKALKSLKAPITPHGVRATFSTHLHAQGFPSHLIEMQLAHAEGNKVKAAYNQAQYLSERRALLQHWADWLTGETASHLQSSSTPAQ